MDNTPGQFDDAPYESMSPTLLAAQPVSLPLRRDLPDIDWDVVYTHLQSRLSSLRNWRFSWWSHWAILAEYFLPRRYVWLVTANRMTKGRPINDAIIDSTGLLAVNICASGLWSGLTPPSRPWFKFAPAIDTVELDADAQSWLEECESRVYSILAQSNFYSTMAQAFQDVTVFGTAPVIIYEDAETIIRCYLPCAGEYYLAAGARLSIDTLYREFTLTVSQVVEMFRLDNCPPEVVDKWNEGGAALEYEFVVAHAIEPNFAIASKGAKKRSIDVVPGKFTFREIYWLKSIKTARPLSKRGFMGKPFFAALWNRKSNDAYGRSPCMDALGDNKQIQVETRRLAEYIEKGVRPPMGADVSLKNEPASVLPAQITFMNTANGKQQFFPLFEVDPNWVAVLTKNIADVAARINRALFVDIFMAITQMQGVQPRNELELTKRDLERLQVLGPPINLFLTEFADPAIMRVVDIAERRRILPPRPPSLDGVPLKIGFDTIMQIAQRAAEGVAMKDVFQTGGVLSSAAKAAGLPDPLRCMNLDKAYRFYGETQHFRGSLFFSEQQVQENDAARAQARQQQEVLPTTMAGVSAAKTLADTSVAGGSLLHAVLTGDTQNQ